MKSTKIYPKTGTETQSVKSTEIYPELTPSSTSKEESIKTEIYPVIYPKKMDSSKQEESNVTTTLTETSMERRTEIYPEIYPENSLGATRGSLQSREEESTPHMHKLSNFEKELIEMFEIPENFKETSSLDSIQVDLDLQTTLNLALEENSLLDLLNDSEIV